MSPIIKGEAAQKVFFLDSLTIIYIISTWSSVKIIYDKYIPHKFCIYIYIYLDK